MTKELFLTLSIAEAYVTIRQEIGASVEGEMVLVLRGDVVEIGRMILLK